MVVTEKIFYKPMPVVKLCSGRAGFLGHVFINVLLKCWWGRTAAKIWPDNLRQDKPRFDSELIANGTVGLDLGGLLVGRTAD